MVSPAKTNADAATGPAQHSQPSIGETEGKTKAIAGNRFSGGMPRGFWPPNPSLPGRKL